MHSVNVHEAKTKLSALLAEIEKKWRTNPHLPTRQANS